MKIENRDQNQINLLKGQILKMVFSAKEGHIPSAFSILDILFVLYRDVLRFDSVNPKAVDRDIFVLSKGHAGAALYAVLGHFNFFSSELLDSYCKSGSLFGGHPDALKVPGVEVSSGSLGHGIAMATGIATAIKQKGQDRRVFVLVGDGEMDEGSFWESIMLIRNLNLKNLVLIADFNKSQKYSFNYDYANILKAFGWSVKDINGHDHNEILKALQEPNRMNQREPHFILAHTVKGQGIKRFLGEHAWHRRTPTETELSELISELE